MENYLSLLGVLIVILGFAFKLDSILIVMVALVVTALTGGLGHSRNVRTFRYKFCKQSGGMAIFIIIMLATGTLERNGLKESAASLIKQIQESICWYDCRYLWDLSNDLCGF